MDFKKRTDDVCIEWNDGKGSLAQLIESALREVYKEGYNQGIEDGAVLANEKVDPWNAYRISDAIRRLRKEWGIND